MNNAQRVLLAVYLPLTLFILIMDNLFTGFDMVQYAKYAVIVTLFLAACWVDKAAAEQNMMTRAILLVTAADFFLVLLPTITGLDYTVIGAAGFSLAYICIIIANQKNFRLGLAEIMCAILVGGISLTVFLLLPLEEISRWRLIGVICFAMILAYMTWTSICTIFRRYYRLKVALILAFSAMLMFVSDLAVAYVHFNLHYTALYQPWMQNLVWAAYIPAWTLLAVVVSEDNPYHRVRWQNSS